MEVDFDFGSLVVSCGFTFTAIFLIYNAAIRLNKWRRMTSMARTRVGDIKTGRLEVQGYAWPAEGRMTITVEEKYAVWRKVEIIRFRRKHNQTILKDIYNPTFFVTDGTAWVTLNPSAFQVDATETCYNWHSMSKAAQGRINTLLDKPGRRKVSLMGPIMTYLDRRRWSVHEFVILIGSPIYVLGGAKVKSYAQAGRPQAGFLAFQSEVQRREARRPLLYANGQKKAYRPTPGAFYGVAQNAMQKSEPPIDLVCNITIEASKNEQSLLADCHEEDYVQRLAIKMAFLEILVALVLLTLAAVLIINETHPDLLPLLKTYLPQEAPSRRHRWRG